MQEWYSVLFALLAIVGLLAFVCLLMSIFVQTNEDGLDDVLNELEDRCEKENDKMINNLDEAIKHCHEKAKELKKKADCYTKNGCGYLQASEFEQNEIAECLECAKEHEQLAGWLTELKELREEHTRAIKLLQEICPYRTFRYLEDSHAKGELYCQKPPQNYGYEPECNFQCLKSKENEE